MVPETPATTDSAPPPDRVRALLPWAFPVALLVGVLIIIVSPNWVLSVLALVIGYVIIPSGYAYRRRLRSGRQAAQL
jgi:hypothetical protein